MDIRKYEVTFMIGCPRCLSYHFEIGNYADLAKDELANAIIDHKEKEIIINENRHCPSCLADWDF